MPARRTRTTPTAPVPRVARRKAATRPVEAPPAADAPGRVCNLLRATQLARTISGLTPTDIGRHLGLDYTSVNRYLAGDGANEYLLQMAHVLSSFHALVTMTIDGVERVIPLEDPDPERLVASEQRILTMFSGFSNTPVDLANYSKLRERFTRDTGQKGTVEVANLDEVIIREINGRDIKPYLLAINTGIKYVRAVKLGQGNSGKNGSMIYDIWDALRIGVTVRIQGMTYRLGKPGPLPTSPAELGPVHPGRKRIRS